MVARLIQLLGVDIGKSLEKRLNNDVDVMHFVVTIIITALEHYTKMNQLRLTLNISSLHIGYEKEFSIKMQLIIDIANFIGRDLYKVNINEL